MERTDCVKQFNKLLRGEISATETYVQAINNIDDSSEKEQLRDILKDHQQSILTIKKHIEDLGGSAESGSGVWGLFAMAVEGSANVLGTTATIAALQQGELLGVDDYKDALENEALLPECRAIILNELMPMCEDHVVTLERMNNGPELN